MKIRVFTLTNEEATPKCIGTMKAEVGESLADRRLRFEEKQVLNFRFQFWDVQESCRVAVALESLNDIEHSVHVIPALDVEDEFEDVLRKQQRLESNANIDDCRESNDVELDVLEVPEFTEIENNGPADIQSDPASCSRVSAPTSECFLQSQVLSAEVLALYTEGEQKLRKVLADISLEDHDWCLKSYDHHGKAIVILHCLECKKDFGGTEGQHYKDKISNLFSNFRKSHIMSNQHIRSWCLRKGLDWCNHPQSLAKGKKTVVLSTEDHRRLVQEGVRILHEVNTSLDPACITFELLGGDPMTTELKSFWWKTKCVTCNDVYNLCPPKNNLEANLRNHAGGSKHAEKVLQAANSVSTSLFSGKRGRPSKSSSNSTNSNQKQLHAFFSYAVDNP